MFVRYRKILQYITKLYDHTISYRIIPSYNILRKNNKIRLGRSKCDFIYLALYRPSAVKTSATTYSTAPTCGYSVTQRPLTGATQWTPEAMNVPCLAYTTWVEPRWSNPGGRTSVLEPRWSNLGGRTSVLVEPRFWSNFGLGRTSVQVDPRCNHQLHPVQQALVSRAPRPIGLCRPMPAIKDLPSCLEKCGRPSRDNEMDS